MSVVQKNKFDEVIKRAKNCKEEYKPEILDLRKTKDFLRFESLVLSQEVLHIIDEYESQLLEFFDVTNPTLVFQDNIGRERMKFLEEKKIAGPLYQQGKWVYYPWISTIVHVLDEQAFFTTKTARNKDLVTKEEQNKFYSSRVGIVGLSIGNSIALNLVLKGGAKFLKLADFDYLEVSNLNRIRTGVNNVGLKKTHLTAREIYELNPYAEVEFQIKGLNKNNIESFLCDLDIVVDEIDDFPTKVLIRECAKKMRIPVITAIDNADGSVLEIERYDIDPKTEPFHGRIRQINYDRSKKMSKDEVGKLIACNVGLENIGERMQQSYSQIGKNLVSWPQLGSSALLNGALVAYCIRKIILGERIKNRVVLSFDDIFQITKTSKSQMAKTLQKSKELFEM